MKKKLLLLYFLFCYVTCFFRNMDTDFSLVKRTHRKGGQKEVNGLRITTPGRRIVLQIW